jgi:hypothetical protein
MSSGLANGAVSTIPPNSPVYVYFNMTGSVVTYYTVPTGKTFYCQGIFINCTSTGIGTMYVDATTLFALEMTETQTQTVAGNPIFSMTEGETLRAQKTTGDYSIAVWGYLL